MVITLIRQIFVRMQATGAEIQASGNPPNPDLLAKMQSLVIRLGKLGRIALIFLIIAILGMASARFIPF